MPIRPTLCTSFYTTLSEKCNYYQLKEFFSFSTLHCFYYCDKRNSTKDIEVFCFINEKGCRQDAVCFPKYFQWNVFQYPHHYLPFCENSARSQLRRIFSISHYTICILFKLRQLFLNKLISFLNYNY